MNIKHLSSFPETIRIPSQESWVIIDSGDHDAEQTVVLGEGSKLDLYSARTSGKLDLRIVHRGTGSESRIRCAFHTPENGRIDATLKTVFEAGHGTSEIHILSLAETGGETLLDSAIDIREGVTGAVGRLKERHIFLGSGGKIRGIPALIVHSDDIEASHALAIDRISDEELFYLRSRGFHADDATGLLLHGAVSEVFSGLSGLDEAVFEQMKDSILRI